MLADGDLLTAASFDVLFTCLSTAAEFGLGTDGVNIEGTDLAGRRGPW